MAEDRKLMSWLEDRLPLAAAREFAKHKTVPVHKSTVFYYLGGMTLFFWGSKQACRVDPTARSAPLEASVIR